MGSGDERNQRLRRGGPFARPTLREVNDHIHREESHPLDPNPPWIMCEIRVVDLSIISSLRILVGGDGTLLCRGRTGEPTTLKVHVVGVHWLCPTWDGAHRITWPGLTYVVVGNGKKMGKLRIKKILILRFYLKFGYFLFYKINWRSWDLN